MLTEGVLQHLRVEAEGRRHERHEHRLAARHDGLGAVILKVGREHHDLVARIRKGKNGVHHRLGRADGHNHLGLGIVFHAHEALALARERLTEVRRPHRDGILVRAEPADLLQSVGHRLGRVKVRKALRQIDRAAVDADARHPSDDGVGKMLVSSAQFLHGITAPFLICPCRQSLRPSRPRTFYNSETLTLLLDKVNRPFVQNQDKRAAASHALRGSRFLRCRTAAAGTRPAAQGSTAGRRRPSAPQ